MTTPATTPQAQPGTLPPLNGARGRPLVRLRQPRKRSLSLTSEDVPDYSRQLALTRRELERQAIRRQPMPPLFADPRATGRKGRVFRARADTGGAQERHGIVVTAPEPRDGALPAVAGADGGADADVSMFTQLRRRQLQQTQGAATSELRSHLAAVTTADQLKRLSFTGMGIQLDASAPSLASLGAGADESAGGLGLPVRGATDEAAAAVALTPSPKSTGGRRLRVTRMRLAGSRALSRDTEPNAAAAPAAAGEAAASDADAVDSELAGGAGSFGSERSASQRGAQPRGVQRVRSGAELSEADGDGSFSSVDGAQRGSAVPPDAPEAGEGEAVQSDAQPQMPLEKAVEALRAVPLFSALSLEELAALASEAELHTYPRDHKIYRDGAPASWMAVLLTGSVVVTDQRSRRDVYERRVATSRPRVFGKEGCATRQLPRLGTAVATSECLVLAIGRAHAPSSVRDACQSAVVSSHLAQCPLFERAANEPRLLPLFSVEHYERGSVVVYQGDRADCLFVHATGVVEVFVDAAVEGAPPVRVATLSAHERVSCIGEFALLSSGYGKRTSTVRTRTECVMLRLDVLHFGTLTDLLPDLVSTIKRGHKLTRANDRTTRAETVERDETTAAAPGGPRNRSAVTIKLDTSIEGQLELESMSPLYRRAGALLEDADRPRFDGGVPALRRSPSGSVAAPSPTASANGGFAALQDTLSLSESNALLPSPTNGGASGARRGSTLLAASPADGGHRAGVEREQEMKAEIRGMRGAMGFAQAATATAARRTKSGGDATVAADEPTTVSRQHSQQ